MKSSDLTPLLDDIRAGEAQAEALERELAAVRGSSLALCESVASLMKEAEGENLTAQQWRSLLAGREAEVARACGCWSER